MKMLVLLHFAAAIFIAIGLPQAYERGPLWWSIAGAILCLANAFMAVVWMLDPEPGGKPDA